MLSNRPGDLGKEVLSSWQGKLLWGLRGACWGGGWGLLLGAYY